MAENKKVELDAPLGAEVPQTESDSTAADVAGGLPAVSDVGKGSTSLDDLYDRFMKLIYLIDGSGSMADGMPDGDLSKMFKWPAELLAKFRQAIRDDKSPSSELRNALGGGGIVGTLSEEEDEEPSDDLAEALVVVPDEMLKQMILALKLYDVYKISLERDWTFRSRGQSKLDVVKGAASKFVMQRFDKYPDADVLVYKFEDRPVLLSRRATREDVLRGISNLYPGGGTNIFNAVLSAVEQCKAHPSNVGTHHVILISDGQDGGAMQVKSLLPKMKELGVTFDFIYVSAPLGSLYETDKAVTDVLREVCEATGGAYTDIRTAEEFKTKFFEISARKCLPPKRD